MALAGAVALVLAVLVAGFLLGWLVLGKVRRKGVESARATAQRIVSKAEVDAVALVKTAALEVRDEWRREREPLELAMEASKRSARELEARLAEREQQLDRKVDLLESKERTLVKSDQDISQREEVVAVTLHAEGVGDGDARHAAARRRGPRGLAKGGFAGLMAVK